MIGWYWRAKALFAENVNADRIKARLRSTVAARVAIFRNLRLLPSSRLSLISIPRQAVRAPNRQAKKKKAASEIWKEESISAGVVPGVYRLFKTRVSAILPTQKTSRPIRVSFLPAGIDCFSLASIFDQRCDYPVICFLGKFYHVTRR